MTPSHPQSRSAPLVRRTLDSLSASARESKSIAGNSVCTAPAYSPAGRGTVAYIDIPGSAGLTAVCTDNPDLADFITATMIRGSNNPFDRDLCLKWRATFSRAGRIDRNPSWTVQSEHHTLTATWGQLESPLVGPPTINPHIVFTVLIFAICRPDATRRHGRTRPCPYPRDAWSKSLRSSP